MDTVGSRIQQARERKVLNRSELARKAGISYDAVLMIETERRNPTTATIRAIATALDLDPYDLVRNLP